MAARKRNQDEKNLKLLRELATLPCNKQCFDCRQKGPTYINMTIGSFVCTACSGILRGLNPPHRVKSISMTSFSSEDIDFIKSKGNDFCRKVWFGLSDPKVNLGPESKDEQKLKDFMMQVYDKKKWWIDPSKVAASISKIEQSVISPPEKVPLSTLLGKSHTPLYVPKTQPNPTPMSSSATDQSSVPTVDKKVDLFAEFGSDPFGGSSNNQAGDSNSNFANFGQSNSDGFANFGQSTTDNSGNFANFDNNPAFSNTGGSLTSPLDQPFSTPPTNVGTNSTNDLVPLKTNGVGLAPSDPNNSTSLNSLNPTSTTTTSFASAGDRYAALADLDTMFSTSTVESSSWDTSTTVTTTVTSNSLWQTNIPGSNVATSGAMPSSVFGGDATVSNPFGGDANSGTNTMWNQPSQQNTSQVNSNQMWNQGASGAAWGEQPMIQQQPQQVPGMQWNASSAGQSGSKASWMTPGPANQQTNQSWNQQPMPSQAAFSTGNPFQMNQAPPSISASPQSGFPVQPSMMGGQMFPGQACAVTTTVPSDANSAFGNFGTPAFPPQNTLSSANNMPSGTMPMQNGGFNMGSNSNPVQFTNWPNNQGSVPSNPFLGGGTGQSAAMPKMNSSNPFL